MYFQIFIQLLAIIALIIWSSSYHFKDRRTILLVQLISFIFWIIHFVLIGAITGMVISIIAAIRLFVFSFKTKDNWIANPLVSWFFIIISIIFTYFTMTAYWAVFALLGGILAIIASIQDDENKIRIFFIPSHIMWVVYDIFAGSYGGAISEGVLGLSAFISLFKKKINL